MVNKMPLIGVLKIALLLIIWISMLAFLLINLCLAWTNPKKLVDFQKNVTFRLPGYDLFPKLVQAPLTKQRLWAIRIGLLPPTLVLIGAIILAIFLISQWASQ